MKNIWKYQFFQNAAATILTGVLKGVYNFIFIGHRLVFRPNSNAVFDLESPEGKRYPAFLRAGEGGTNSKNTAFQ